VISEIVFGGTFDPVHNGHLAIARQARSATGAESVWFVPAALAPLRDAPQASPQDRFELLQAACAGPEAVGMTVLDVAIRRGGLSYTADVMDALRAEHPDRELRVLLGADVARTIGAWHRAADLLRRESFVIVNRSGVPRLDADEAELLGYSAARTILLSVQSPEVSATEIRTRCARGESIDGLVPEAVAALIAKKGMYRQNRDDA
jgi:nicotinate-nucleotide adenylyltransferase